MTSSYESHKAQVEAARSADGKFGIFTSAESGARLGAEECAADAGNSTESIASRITAHLDDHNVEVCGDDTITVGELRADGLAPMTLRRESDNDEWEVIAPDPSGPQNNLTDIVEPVEGSDEQISRYAADFYRDAVSRESAISQSQLPEAHGFDWNDCGERERRVVAGVKSHFDSDPAATVSSYNSGGGVIAHEVSRQTPHGTYSAMLSFEANSPDLQDQHDVTVVASWMHDGAEDFGEERTVAEADVNSAVLDALEDGKGSLRQERNDSMEIAPLSDTEQAEADSYGMDAREYRIMQADLAESPTDTGDELAAEADAVRRGTL